MRSLVDNLESVSAICVGSAAMAFGLPPGAIETVVSAASISSSLLKDRRRFGPECSRVRQSMVNQVLVDYQKFLAAEGGPSSSDELESAARTVERVLADCMIDRAMLARAAISDEGFAKQALALIMSELASRDPDSFGHGQITSLSYRFARDVISTGLRAATDNLDYYRKLEPELVLQLCGTVGEIRTEVFNLSKASKVHLDQGEELLRIQRKQMELISGLAAKLGYPDSARLDSEIEELTSELNATKGELISLVAAIVGDGVDFDDLSSAVIRAKASLDASRTSLANAISSLKDDDILSKLRIANEALHGDSGIDIDLAGSALEAARVKYDALLSGRRRNDADTYSLILIAEAELASARRNFIEAGRSYSVAADCIEPFDPVRCGAYRLEAARYFCLDGERCDNCTSFENAIAELGKVSTQYDGSTRPVGDRLEYLGALASSWFGLGEASTDQRSLPAVQKALELYEAALSLCLRSPSEIPEDSLCVAYFNIGLTLDSLSARLRKSGSSTAKKRAVEAYSKALSSLQVHQNGIPTIFELRLYTSLFRAYAETGMRFEQSGLQAILVQSLGVLEECVDNHTCHQPEEAQEHRMLLASAFFSVGKSMSGGESTRYLRKSAELFERVLQDSSDIAPSTHLVAVNTLSNVYASLARSSVVEGGEDSYARKSVMLARQGVNLASVKRISPGWMDAQGLLGQALLSSENIDRGEVLEAVASCRASLEQLTEESLPGLWSNHHGMLGLALARLSTLSEPDEAQKFARESISCFEAALKNIDPDTDSESWAGWHNNLGVAHRSLAALLKGEEAVNEFEASIACLKIAQSFRDRSKTPQDWATSTDDIGITLSMYARTLRGAAMVAKMRLAIEFYELALEYRSKLFDSSEWRVSTSNMALAYYFLSQGVKGDERIKYLDKSLALTMDCSGVTFDNLSSAPLQIKLRIFDVLSSKFIKGGKVRDIELCDKLSFVAAEVFMASGDVSPSTEVRIRWAVLMSLFYRLHEDEINKGETTAYIKMHLLKIVFVSRKNRLLLSWLSAALVGVFFRAKSFMSI